MTSDWEGEFSQKYTSVLALSPLNVLNLLLSPVLLLKLFYTETDFFLHLFLFNLVYFLYSTFLYGVH